MNRKADIENEERFEERLAEYATALDSGLAEPADPSTLGQVDPELATRLLRAQSCLRLLDRVRRTRPDSLDTRNPEARDVRADAATAREFPQSIGRFRIVRPLGYGGAGMVFLAVDPELGREVALKVPRPTVLTTSELKQRFLREGKAAASLNHANIVPVFEARSIGPISYIASVYSPGVSLADWLARRDGPVPDRLAAEIVAQLADAVQHAHSRGVLHRDLKPSNVLMEAASPAADASGERNEACVPKITDFGLAKLDGVDSGVTRTGTILGTPAYMAPEQASGSPQPVGPAADTYALGAILYEMLTGRMPFQRESTLATLRAVEEEEPVAPRHLRPGVSRDLEAICLKCLEKNPGRRFASASALAEDLHRFLTGQAIHARRIGGTERFWRWCRRHPSWAALMAVSMAAALALVSIGSWSAARISALNKIAHLAQTARDEAQGRADAEHRTGEVHRFHSVLSSGKEKRGDARPGWTWQALGDLQQAAELPPAKDHRAELRSEVIACLASVDLRLSGTLQQGLDAHCLAYSPDGRFLAVGENHSSSEISIAIVDVVTGGPVHRLKFSGDASYVVRSARLDGIRSLAYTPDGRGLAAGTKSGWIHMWNVVQSPPQRKAWKAHHDWVSDLAFHPDGDRLYSASHDGDVKQWKIAADPVALENSYLGGSKDASGPVQDMHLSWDGTVVACAGGTALLEGLRLQPALAWASSSETSTTRCVCFAPLGHVIASGVTDGRILLRDVRTGELLRELIDNSLVPARDREVCHLDFHPSGSLLVSTSADQRFKLWEVASGRLLASVLVGGNANVYPAFSPDGRYLAVTGGDKINLYELSSLDLQTFVAPHRQPLRAFDFTPQGDRVIVWAAAAAASDSYGSISAWPLDGTSPTVSWPLPQTHAGQVWLMHHPLKNLLALTATESRQVMLLDYENGYSHSIPVQAPRGVAFAPAGDQLWLAHGHGAQTPDGRHCDRIEKRAIPWPTVSGGNEPTAPPLAYWDNFGSQVELGYSDIYRLAVGKRLVAAASRDGSAKLLTTDTADFFRSFPSEGSRVESVALSPDEGLLVFGTRQGGLCVVQTETGKPVASIAVHKDKIQSIDFCQDGKLLVTASWDRVKLWAVADERIEHLATVRLPTGPIVRALLSPDGKKLAVLVQNETAVRVWHLDRFDQTFVPMNLDW